MTDPFIRAYLAIKEPLVISEKAWFSAKVVIICILGIGFCLLFAKPVRAEMVISEHFKKSEFTCHHCGECKINIELIIALEKLRNLIGQPIIVTSGYRCPLHNRNCGGVRHSQHLYGNAVDIKVKDYSPTQIAYLAKQCGFTWTKTYSTWTHIDVRSK